MDLRSTALQTAFFLCAASAAAQAPVYENLGDWEEVAVPSKSDAVEHCVWLRAANASPVNWHVYAKAGPVFATQNPRRSNAPLFGPVTVAQATFRGGLAVEVDDGWIVGFNGGEFGAAVYWFSKDGKRRYEISRHQVVQFAELPRGLHAIQGLAHLGLSEGSLIRLAKTGTRGRWQAIDVARLPGAPYAAAKRRDGALLVVLADGIVVIDSDYRIQALLGGAPWASLYPTSAELAGDETFLYVGMRQFVAKVNLADRTVRHLIPSRASLNKLEPHEEATIRSDKRPCGG